MASPAGSESFALDTPPAERERAPPRFTRPWTMGRRPSAAASCPASWGLIPSRHAQATCPPTQREPRNPPLPTPTAPVPTREGKREARHSRSLRTPRPVVTGAGIHGQKSLAYLPARPPRSPRPTSASLASPQWAHPEVFAHYHGRRGAGTGSCRTPRTRERRTSRRRATTCRAGAASAGQDALVSCTLNHDKFMAVYGSGRNVHGQSRAPHEPGRGGST
jgi:hypothetical protein